MSVTSGRWAMYAARAEGPSPASATTSMSGSTPIMARKPTSTTLWSSTTSTRILPSGISAILHVHVYFYLGASPGLRLERQPAQHGRPLAHTGDAEAARLHAGRGFGIETAPVVTNGQRQRALLVAQPDLDVGGGSVG